VINNPSFAWRIWLASWAPLAVISLHAGLAATVGHRDEYDPLFHFLGGVAGAYCLLRALSLFRVHLGPLNRPHPIVIVLVAMFAVAGAWELVEFASDRFLRTQVQFGLDDTAMDVVLGLVGACCTSAVATFFGWRRALSKTDAA